MLLSFVNSEIIGEIEKIKIMIKLDTNVLNKESKLPSPIVLLFFLLTLNPFFFKYFFISRI